MHALLVTCGRNHPTLPALERLLRTRFGVAAPECGGPARAEELCRGEAPPVVFVLLDGDGADGGLETVRRLRAVGSDHLFAVGPATDPKYILRTMQAGADLYLDQAELETELESALGRVRGGRSAGDRPSQLIAVLSAAGGCGASTVAVNLAALLATAHGRSHLIDLNPGKADLGPLLDLKPQYTLADLCRNEDRLDRSMYEKMLVTHRTGVALLAAPREYADVRAVTAGGVDRAVAFARESFTDIVVDVDDCFHAEQVCVLEQATRVLLVCRLDFTAVRNTRRILDHLVSLGVPRDRIEVVVNNFGVPGELPVEEAETALGETLTYFIPHDPATHYAANTTGIPAALTAPAGAAVQSIARILGLHSKAAAGPAPLARFAGQVRSQFVPRFRSLRARFARLTPAPPSEADETKVHYESNITETVRIDARARPVSV